MTTYYKTLSADGRSCHGGKSKWSLPALRPDGSYKPGRWMPPIEDIKPCVRGYHVFERQNVLAWLGETMYEAEARGATIDHDDKTVCESARLLRPVPGYNARTLRLYACRVAEDVLPLYEAEHPEDDRPRHAIETARRYAEGEVTLGELAAASDAALAATRDAALAATRDAALAAARDAALAAAWAVAWDAAWDAASAWAVAARAKYTDWLWEMIGEAT